MSTISGVSGSNSNAWSNMAAMRSQQQAKMFAKVDADGNGGVDKSELKTMLADMAKKMGATDSTSATGSSDSDALFTKMDSNGDGSLTATELDSGMKAIMPPPPSTMDFAQARSGATSESGSDDLFAKIDSDGNGSVSQSELQTLIDALGGGKASTTNAASDTASEASSELFAKLDTDGDGTLSSTEFEAGRPPEGQGPQGAGGMPPPPPSGGAAGASSASSGSSSTTYDDLDTNQDGTVSAAERMAGNTKTDPLQALLKAIDSDGDSKISSAESDTFIQKLTSQLESLSQSGQSASSSTNSDASQDSVESVDLAQLVQRAYEQIANGLAQQAKGSTLNAVA